MNVNQDPSHPGHDRLGFNSFSNSLYIGGAWRPAEGAGWIQVKQRSPPLPTIRNMAATSAVACALLRRWRQV